jgi:hypothetical protein
LREPHPRARCESREVHDDVEPLGRRDVDSVVGDGPREQAAVPADLHQRPAA